MASLPKPTSCRKPSSFSSSSDMDDISWASHPQQYFVGLILCTSWACHLGHAVLGMPSRLLWVPLCNGIVMPSRYLFVTDIYSLWLLQSFSTLYWALEEGSGDVPLLSEQVTVSYSLSVDHLWLSGLFTVYYKKATSLMKNERCSDR